MKPRTLNKKTLVFRLVHLYWEAAKTISFLKTHYKFDVIFALFFSRSYKVINYHFISDFRPGVIVFLNQIIIKYFNCKEARRMFLFSGRNVHDFLNIIPSTSMYDRIKSILKYFNVDASGIFWSTCLG